MTRVEASRRGGLASAKHFTHEQQVQRGREGGRTSVISRRLKISAEIVGMSPIEAYTRGYRNGQAAGYAQRRQRRTYRRIA